ncbi:hypothetical protein BH10ACI4_BH10ACI4_38930 [soil metagenome]
MRISLTPLGKSTSIIAGTALVIALTYAAAALGRGARQGTSSESTRTSQTLRTSATDRRSWEVQGQTLTEYQKRSLRTSGPPRAFVDGRYVEVDEQSGR